MPKLATYLAEVSWIEVVEYFNVVVIVVGACGDVGRCVGVDFVAGGADARDRFLEAITTEKQILSKKKLRCKVASKITEQRQNDFHVAIASKIPSY